MHKRNMKEAIPKGGGSPLEKLLFCCFSVNLSTPRAHYHVRDQ